MTSRFQLARSLPKLPGRPETLKSSGRFSPSTGWLGSMAVLAFVRLVPSAQRRHKLSQL